MNTSEAQVVDTDNLADLEYPLPEKTLLSYLLFLPFAIFFFLVLCFFDVTQKIALATGGGKAQEKIARVLNRWVLHSLRVLGTRFEISGDTKVDPSKPYIIVSNHQSMFDLSTIYTAFAELRPRYIAKIELAKNIPSISVCLRTDGSALIDRSNPRQAIPAIRALGKRMNEHGFSTIIFPEGTRARRGKLKEFRATGLAVLLDSVPDAQIIPVAIDESWKLTAYPKGPVPVGIKIKLRVGDVIDPQGRKSAEVLAEAYESVRTMLHQIRAAQD